LDKYKQIGVFNIRGFYDFTDALYLVPNHYHPHTGKDMTECVTQAYPQSS